VDFGWIESEHRFKVFDPKPKQQEFILTKKKYSTFIGAFRSGKSLAASFKAYALSFNYPGNVGLICRKDYTTLRDSTMQTLFGIIPPESPLVVKWNESTHDLWLKTKDPKKPSHIMFRGADEYKKFGSYELGWFWIDQSEEISEMVFNQLSGRLSKPGVPLCGMQTPNPPGQYHWLYRRFKKNFNPETDFVCHTSSYDNRENLPDGYIEDLESHSEQWKRAFLYGEWSFVAEGDPVYADFREDIHVAKAPITVFEGVHVVRSIDPGYLFPACGWFQYIPGKDRTHKLAELMVPNTTADAFADMILEFELKRFPQVPLEHFENVGDPYFLDQKTDKSEATSREIFASKGISPIITSPAYVKDGLNLIRRQLLVRDDGLPAYIIDPSCELTQQAYLGGYFLKKDLDTPDDKCHPYCDIADTDRYFFMNKVQITQPIAMRVKTAYDRQKSIITHFSQGVRNRA